jgi:hypothetical protein
MMRMINYKEVPRSIIPVKIRARVTGEGNPLNTLIDGVQLTAVLRINITKNTTILDVVTLTPVC